MGLIASGALQWNVLASGAACKDVKAEVMLSGSILSGYVTVVTFTALQTRVTALEVFVADLDKRKKDK